MTLLSEFSNSVLSLSKPALHVGEQIGGRAGGNAWAGSGGSWACCSATGGKEAGDTLLQPLTSNSSPIAVSTQSISLKLGVMEFLLLVLGDRPLALLAARLGLKRGLRVAGLEGLDFGHARRVFGAVTIVLAPFVGAE